MEREKRVRGRKGRGGWGGGEGGRELERKIPRDGRSPAF